MILNGKSYEAIPDTGLTRGDKTLSRLVLIVMTAIVAFDIWLSVGALAHLLEGRTLNCAIAERLEGKHGQ